MDKKYMGVGEIKFALNQILMELEEIKKEYPKKMECETAYVIGAIDGHIDTIKEYIEGHIKICNELIQEKRNEYRAGKDETVGGALEAALRRAKAEKDTATEVILCMAKAALNGAVKKENMEKYEAVYCTTKRYNDEMTMYYIRDMMADACFREHKKE